MLGAGACFATGMSAFRYTSGLRGLPSGEEDEDEVERREAMKKLRRRPLSETLEQLGEGRGKHGSVLSTWLFANNTRYLRSWIRGEEATKDHGQVRNRCKGSAGLDAPRNFLGVHNRSRHRDSKIEHFATLVHTTCSTGLEMSNYHQVHWTDYPRSCIVQICDDSLLASVIVNFLVNSEAISWSRSRSNNSECLAQPAPRRHGKKELDPGEIYHIV
jgi:hypothetical protein